MPDIIITPSTGKLEFVNNSAQNIRKHAFSMDDDGLSLDAPLAATSIKAPLNIINVNVDNSNTNYPFVLASGSAVTGTKTLMMDGAGGTYNPFTNTATIDISGNSATTTLASNSTQLNGQAASYYTDINARLGYTPVNKAGDTVTGNLTVNGNFAVNGSFTAFSASNVYISSSQLYIEDNILTLNAFSPYLRYAGVEMYDSGSGTLSSLLWDGESDYFFLTGSSVNGKIITGPDGQTNLTANYIPKATAGNKLGNSIIYDNGTNVGIGTTVPSTKFHVVGNADIGDSTADTGIIIRHGAGSAQYGRLRFYDSNGLNVNTIHSFPVAWQGGTLLNSSAGAINLTGNNGVTFGSWNSVDVAFGSNSNNYFKNSVGIGTTVPASLLHVYSTSAEPAIRLTSTSGSAKTYGLVCNTPWAPGSLHIYDYTADASRIHISSNGNVGIGVGATSPASLLTVQSNGTQLRLQTTNEPAAYFANIGVRYDSSHPFTIEVSNGAATATEYFGIYADAGGANNRIALLNSNVGIGTSSPAVMLHVQKSQNSETTVIINNTNSGAAAAARLDLQSHANNYLTLQAYGQNFSGNVCGIAGAKLNTILDNALTANSTGLLIGTTSTNPLYFATANSVKMLLSASGNLGIGTTSPAYKLDVNGTIALSGFPFAYKSGNYNILVEPAGTNALYLGNATDPTNYYDNTTHYIRNRGGGSTYVTINSSGNVGIGTTNPTSKLHIVGDSIFNGQISSTGAMAIGMTPAPFWNARFTDYSDGSGVYIGSVQAGGYKYISGESYYNNSSFWQSNKTTSTAIGLGDGILRFYTDSGLTANTNFIPSERMRITSTGCVGIGTTSVRSNSLLDVYGAGVFGTSAYGFYVGTDATGAFLDAGTQLMRMFAGQQERMRITSTGNVGIGTTNPVSKLEVSGSVTATSFTGSLSGSITSALTASYLTPANSYTVTNLNASNISASLTSSFGMIGIGTTSPASKLHIDDASTPYITITRAGVPTWQLRNNFPSNQYGFSFNNTTAGTVPLFIGTGGNIGIGLDSPAAKLDIVGTNSTIALSFGTTVANNPLFINTYGSNTGIGMDQATAGLRLAGDYGGGSNPLVDIGYYSGGTVSHANWISRFKILNSGVTNFAANVYHSIGGQKFFAGSGGTYAYIYTGTTAFNFINSSDSSTLVTILNGGNVGIGTTSPVARLTVTPSGSAFDSSNTMVAYFGKTTANGYGSTFIRVARSDSTTTTGSNAEYTDIEHNSGGATPFRYGTYSDTNIINGGAATNGVYGSINFVTSGSTRMTIAGGTSAGNVGIGTTNPGYKLDVNGPIGISGFRFVDQSTNYFRIFEPAGNIALYLGNAADPTNYYDNTTHYFRNRGGASYYVTINSSGNLGIGTTSPAYKLDVVSGSIRVSSGAQAGELYFGTDSNADLYLKRDNNYDLVLAQNAASGNALYLAGAGNVYVSIDANNNETDRAFIVQNNSIKSGTELFRVQENGSVGIGTTSPLEKLHVLGNIHVQSDSDSLGGAGLYLGISNSRNIAIRQTSTNKNFAVDTYNASESWQNRITILNSGGNVGIGTTNPVGKLDVRAGSGGEIIFGSYDANYVVKIQSGDQLNFYNGASAGAGYINYAGGATVLSQNLHVEKATGGTTGLVRINSNGNVGIGTSTPRQLLHLNGYVLLDGVTNGYEQGATRGIGYGSSAGAVSVDGFSGMDIQSVNAPAPNAGSYSQNLRFWTHHYATGTGGTPRMFLQYNGNLGIGTTAPASKFEVFGGDMSLKMTGVTTGSILFKNSSGTKIQEIRYDDSDGSMTLGGVGGYPIKFITSTTEKVRIAGDGNVGIGTTTTGAKFVVNGGTVNTTTYTTSESRIADGSIHLMKTVAGGIFESIRAMNVDTTAGTTVRVLAAATSDPFNNANGGKVFIDAIRTSTNMDLAFSLNDAAGVAPVERVRFMGSGNVGIGTTSPNTLLNVHGATPFVRINTTATADHGIKISYGNSDTHGLHLLYNANSAVSYIDNTYPVNAGYVYGDIYFRQNVAGTMTTRMTIKADGGNVGIGTTTVPSPLTVYNNSDVWHFRLGGASGELRMGGQTNSGAVIQSYTPGGTVRDLYLQRDGGNIGVGLNNPSSKIHIYENANRVTYITQNNNHTARFEAYGTATAIDTTASNGIFFRISGGDIVKFAADGNVGIGTSLPGRKLDVEGVVRTRGATGTGGFEIGAATTGAAKWRIEWDSASDSLDFNWVG